MQLQGGVASTGAQGSRVTPTPMVQTPVGTVSGSQHSRSSSQTSQLSQVSQTAPSAPTVPVPAPVIAPAIASAPVPSLATQVPLPSPSTLPVGPVRESVKTVQVPSPVNNETKETRVP